MQRNELAVVMHLIRIPIGPLSQRVGVGPRIREQVIELISVASKVDLKLLLNDSGSGWTNEQVDRYIGIAKALKQSNSVYRSARTCDG
jgi:hypothetical protein